MLRAMRRSFLRTLAALMHRAGRNAGALARVKEAMKLVPFADGDAEDRVLLALIHARLGTDSGKEALRWLQRARERKPSRDGGELWRAVLIEVLLDEAARAIKKSAEL
jgi:hypothetical protein